MRSLYESSGLNRIALGLRAWPRTVLRGSAGAPDFKRRRRVAVPRTKLVGISEPERGRCRTLRIHRNCGGPLRRGDSNSPFACLCGRRTSNVTAQRSPWQYPFGSNSSNSHWIFDPTSGGCRHLWLRLLPRANAGARPAGRQRGACAFGRPGECVRRSRFPADRPDRDHGSLGQCADVFTECCSYQRLAAGRRHDESRD